MRQKRHFRVGELEDVRPCDSCGEDYVFLVGEDPGECSRCQRFTRNLGEAERAVSRARRRIVK